MESSPSEQSIDIAIDNDMADNRPQPDEETRVSRPQEKVQGGLKPIKIGAPEASPEPPEPRLQRLNIHCRQNNVNSSMIADIDVPELSWSDCGSVDSDLEPDLDEGDGSNKADDAAHLEIREGPYADSIHELREKEKSRFPNAMMIELETNRLKLSDPGVWDSPSTRTPPPRGFAIIQVSNELGCGHCEEGEVVGVARTLEMANAGAMAYFCRKNRENMCSLRTAGRGQHNRLQAPFVAARDYRGVESFGFRRVSTTRNCSTWGIDGNGCLGLLAVRGTKPSRMVYVKETEYFA
ncbi:hypothetical protein F5B19DRAFT_457818 [Rostrohypoxylon terebratum]|nr:hypothetical protein F5B19DRAFT_457818 [Rostrohypoxylon terebratum]